MLIQRIITAVVLLVPLLALVWYAPTPWVYAVFSVVGLGIAWEWTRLMGVTARGPRIAYLALTAFLLGGVWWHRAEWTWFAAAAAAWWVAAIWLVRGFPESFEKRPPSTLFMSVLGQVLLVPTLISLAALHAMPDGPLRVLYAFFLVFAADVGAYFAGRSLGRHKLAPNVSPGKTIEGAVGGVALCGVWALVAGPFAFQVGGVSLAWFVLVSLVAALFSIVGDLTESMFKRMSGVKDSGNLLPGHGGLLDRVDSIVAAVPILALGVYLLGL